MFDINPHNRIYLSLTFLICSGCSSVSVEHDSSSDISANTSTMPDAIPKTETRSKYGNPESYVVLGKRYHVMDDNNGFTQQGIASWYGTKFHGKRTSMGETYDMHAMTAAHKTLILPAYVEVTNLENSKKVVVKVNDRGPFHENRIIDLSYLAATKIGVAERGTALVKIRVVGPGYTAEPLAEEKQGAPVETRSFDNSPKSFFIQVGAFAELTNAKNLRKKLTMIGHTLIKVSQTVVNDKLLYRVRIGPLSDIEYADEIVQKLIQFDEHDHHIVTN